MFTYNWLGYIVYSPLRLWRAVFPSREEYILTTVLSTRRTTNGNAIPYKDSRGLCKTALLLLSEGVLTPEEATGVYVLVQAKGKQRWRKLNLRSLNHGNKGLLELFEEIQKGEAQLRLRPKDKRLWRLAKRIRVIVRSADGMWQLCEVARVYYGAKPKEARKPYAVTGSIHASELRNLLLSAQREVKEELGREFPLEWFRFDTTRGNGQLDGEHESDAYTGGLSLNQDFDIILELPEWPDEWIENPPVIDDTRIRIYTVCERLEAPAVQPEHQEETSSINLTPAEAFGLRKTFRFNTV